MFGELLFYLLWGLQLATINVYIYICVCMCVLYVYQALQNTHTCTEIHYTNTCVIVDNQ